MTEKKKPADELAQVVQLGQQLKKQLAQASKEFRSLNERVGVVMGGLEELRAAVNSLRDQVQAAITRLNEGGGGNEEEVGSMIDEVNTLRDDLESALGGGGGDEGGTPPAPAAPQAAPPPTAEAARRQRVRDMQINSQRGRTTPPPAAG